MDVLCGAEDAAIEYSAAISDIEGEVLVYCLVVPPALTVDAVARFPIGHGARRWLRSRIF